MTKSSKIANSVSAVLVAAIAWLLVKRKSTAADTTVHVPTPSTTASWPNPKYSTVGYRNNNPLNIVYTGTVWQGEIRPSTDTSLPKKAQFSTMAYGYRAAFITIANYGKLHGLYTLSEIVGRWDSSAAAAYTRAICSMTGWPANKMIDSRNKEEMVALVTAMSKMENGSNVAVPTDSIQQGWNLYKQTI